MTKSELIARLAECYPQLVAKDTEMAVGGELPATLLAAGPGVSSQVFGSALIGLREGLEAGIVVMVLIAFPVLAAGLLVSTLGTLLLGLLITVSMAKTISFPGASLST